MLCPNCHVFLDDVPDLIGRTVLCPRCERTFVMPQTTALRGVIYDPPDLPAQPYIEFPPAPQVNITVNERPPARRLQSGGWFGRSFATTSGVIAALLLTVGVLIFAGLGVQMLLEHSAPASQDRAMEKAARGYALRYLKGHDITELADDVICGEQDGKYIVGGRAKGRYGKVHDFILVYRVGRFAKENRWELDSAMLDGEVLRSNSQP